MVHAIPAVATQRGTCCWITSARADTRAGRRSKTRTWPDRHWAAVGPRPVLHPNRPQRALLLTGRSPTARPSIQQWVVAAHGVLSRCPRTCDTRVANDEFGRAEWRRRDAGERDEQRDERLKGHVVVINEVPRAVPPATESRVTVWAQVIPDARQGSQAATNVAHDATASTGDSRCHPPAGGRARRLQNTLRSYA